MERNEITRDVVCANDSHVLERAETSLKSNIRGSMGAVSPFLSSNFNIFHNPPFTCRCSRSKFSGNSMPPCDGIRVAYLWSAKGISSRDLFGVRGFSGREKINLARFRETRVSREKRVCTCFRFPLYSTITKCSWRNYVKDWTLGSFSRRLAMFSSMWYVSSSIILFNSTFTSIFSIIFFPTILIFVIPGCSIYSVYPIRGGLFVWSFRQMKYCN